MGSSAVRCAVADRGLSWCSRPVGWGTPSSASICVELGFCTSRNLPLALVPTAGPPEGARWASLHGIGPMPSRRSTARPVASAPSPSREQRDARVVKLQIALAVFGPMLLLGAWLQSRGFFGSPGL